MDADISPRVRLPRDDEWLDGVQWDVSNLRDDQRVPAPRYRHAAPSAPWPWMDFDQDVPDIVAPAPSPGEEPWSGYPQCDFGNWTPDQVHRCRMLTICKDTNVCQIHKVDVFLDGTFDRVEEHTRRVPLDPASVTAFWEELQQPIEHLRVRALFVENMALDVLRILGKTYTIEPFFFASSANWIPSRYQENPQSGVGDHITVVLPFIRAMDNPKIGTTPNTHHLVENGRTAFIDSKETIDTQAPLILSDEKILLQDLLAIHMVRDKKACTIISYHHRSDLQKTTARRLRSLVQRTGDSVYWRKLYRRSKDPTFVFLAILWYALYEWDEALEILYAHLSEQLEANATDARSSTSSYTRELHKLQAHLLYYQQLLCDFRKSVQFVQDTPNPAMDDDLDRESSTELLKLETDHLLGEIERLEKQRAIQFARLKNATRLALTTVQIVDNKQMQALTRATLGDSAAMKMISYLSMIFLPATFLASVFGTNLHEINPSTPSPISAYIESTIILTAITAWVAIALQNDSIFHTGEPGRRQYIRRFAWPISYSYAQIRGWVEVTKERFRRQR